MADEDLSDGLTAEERAFLQQPVSQVPPEERHLLLALRDKKAAHNYALNEIYRREQAQKRHAEMYKGASDAKRRSK